MAMLPFEIIFEEILPKLPAKSLVRFKCVSKSFKTLISSSKFTSLHLRHSLSSNANRLLVVSIRYGHLNHLFSIDLDSLENPPKPLPMPATFVPIRSNPIVGSCNGLVMILCFNVDKAGPMKLMLINPSTGLYSMLRLPVSLCSYCVICGFGYDGLTGDYKVVGINGKCISVCNLRDGSWQRIADDSYKDDITGKLIRHGVMVSHLCHWLVFCPLRNKHRIVCFDLHTESWTKDVPLPEYNSVSPGSGSGSDLHFADHLFNICRDDKRDDVTNLGVFDGFLSVMTVNTGRNGLDVCVMKEYGVAESWVKMFTVPNRHYTPMAYARGSSSKVLFCIGSENEEGRLIWYNIRNTQFGKAEFHDIHGVHGVGVGVGHLLNGACVVNGTLVTAPLAL